MPRIYLPVIHPSDNQISIRGEKSHYLTSVLRCRKGDDLIVFDGEGNCFRTSLIKSDKKEVIVEIIEKFPCNLESPLGITLVQGLLKGEKMDMVVQKTTELGVKAIIPVITERSQLRETRKIARWRKIAEEASRQSGRSVVPTVHEPVEFKNIFSDATTNYPPLSPLNKGGTKGSGFIFYEEGGMTLSEAFSSFILHPPSLIILVGPEGGFTKKEIAFAAAKGLFVASLGKRILRAETAAITAVALAQFLLGDMG